MKRMLKEGLAGPTFLFCLGFYLLSGNVFAQNCDGGMVQTESGMDTAQICKDANPSVIGFDSMNVSGANFRYIITDANDDVLNVKSDDMQNFNGAPVGECHVYGIAYDGTLQNTSQGTPVEQVSATNCDSLSRNYITVIRNATDGGMVQTEGGMDTAQICKDANPSVIGFDSMNVFGSNFRYIITDANDDVLNVKSDDMQNFNGAPVGECHVYGIAYEGQLQNTSQGTPIEQVSASICDSLSRNYITVIRNATDGGMVQTESGMDTAQICKDANPSVIGFDSMNVSGSNFHYIITDANDDILNVKTDDMQNFNGAPVGECHVYGVAYKGELQDTSQGTPVEQVSASVCDSLSRNYITVIRNATDGGMVQTESGMDTAEICKDANASVIGFDSMNVSGSNYRYIITDANDDVLNVKSGDMQNFNGAPVGECHVYGIAYKGQLQNTSQGTPVEQVSATICDSLSRNYITVLRDTMVGGTVETANGEDSLEIVVDDQADNVDFMTSSPTKMNNYRYIITDAQDSILNPNAGTSQNFNPAGVGECHVYGVAYQGDLTAMKGMAISDISATVCMERSDNYIVVTRVDGGSSGLTSNASSSKAIDLYPNPAQTNVRLEIDAPQSGVAELTITDISGQTVIREQKGLETGTNTFEIALEPGMQGSYIIAIQQADQVYHQKLLVR